MLDKMMISIPKWTSYLDWFVMMNPTACLSFSTEFPEVKLPPSSSLWDLTSLISRIKVKQLVIQYSYSSSKTLNNWKWKYWKYAKVSHSIRIRCLKATQDRCATKRLLSFRLKSRNPLIYFRSLAKGSANTSLTFRRLEETENKTALFAKWISSHCTSSTWREKSWSSLSSIRWRLMMDR